MPWVPEHVFKGSILQKMDALLAGGNPLRDQFLTDIQATAAGGGWARQLEEISADPKYGVLQTARRLSTQERIGTESQLLNDEESENVITLQGTDLIIDEKKHMRMDWYTPQSVSGPGGWWMAQTPSVEDIIRQALVEAITTAKGKGGLSVVTNWICVGPRTGAKANPVQCYVAWNAQEVVLTILTPEHPYGEMAAAMVSAVGKDNLSQQAARAQPNGVIVVKPTQNAGGMMVLESDVAEAWN